MYDSDDEDGIFNQGIGGKLFLLFHELHEVTERELMKFSAEELRLLRLQYQDGLIYPIYSQIDQILDGALPSETIH